MGPVFHWFGASLFATSGAVLLFLASLTEFEPYTRPIDREEYAQVQAVTAFASAFYKEAQTWPTHTQIKEWVLSSKQPLTEDGRAFQCSAEEGVVACSWTSGGTYVSWSAARSEVVEFAPEDDVGFGSPLKNLVVLVVFGFGALWMAWWVAPRRGENAS